MLWTEDMSASLELDGPWQELNPGHVADRYFTHQASVVVIVTRTENLNASATTLNYFEVRHEIIKQQNSPDAGSGRGG
jgi:hypothetical protein